MVVKVLTLITMDMAWNSLSIKPLVSQGFCDHFCFLFGVMTATLNLEKAYIITKTFPCPFLLGSNFMKSKHNRSIGLFTTIDPWGGSGSVYGPLAVLQHWQFLPTLNIIQHSVPIKSLSYTGYCTFLILMTILIMEHPHPHSLGPAFNG